MSSWILILRNFNTFFSYAQASITNAQKTYTDARRFTVIDLTESYIDLSTRFREFKKVYLQSINGKGQFILNSNLTINFSSYIMTKYDFVVRGRVWYFMNSWVYTTNHKRIAVNYFWFVIFAGLCGMSLATIIRLEMAYPGVGILAGDSLQYLSVVTAHAVVMVFFMIMPLLFGAFGNFLLPTQLGVHDVAFPRLNSAAFWFLPGGLIMLCQLLCLDRRYQRMNCFNVRELQALLKNRFFTELVSSKDHHQFLDQTAIGIRFKTNSLDVINSNALLAFRYGLNVQPQLKPQSYDTTVFEDPNTGHVFFNQTSVLWLSATEFTNLLQNKTTSYCYRTIWAVLESVKQSNSLRYLDVFSWTSIGSLVIAIPLMLKNEADRVLTTLNHFMVLAESFSSFCHHYFKLVTAFVYKTLVILWEDNTSFQTSMQIGAAFGGGLPDNPFIDGTSPDVVFLRSVVKFFARSCYVLSTYTLGLDSIRLNEDRLEVENDLLRGFSSVNKFLGPETRMGFDLSRETYAYFLLGSTKLLIDVVWSLVANFLITCKSFLFNFIYPQASLAAFVVNFKSTAASCSDGLLFLGLWSPSFIYLTILAAFNGFKSQSFVVNNMESLRFISNTFESNSLTEDRLLSSEESSNVYRYQRHQNPIFKPDFKSGNFFTRDDFLRRPALLTTISDLTKGARKPVWFLSDVYLEALNNLTTNYFNFFTSKSTSPEGDFRVGATFLQNPYGFFNVFHLFNTSRVFDKNENLGVPQEQPFVNQRWLALNALDQKFYRMHNTMSLQQRVVSNWRQLKFSREGWRCRLLAARHQKTLFRRYVREDGMLWAFERNAKDVLPGWAMITPFSARTRFTAIGKVDIGLMGVFLVLNSSIVSSANFLVTYRYLSTLNNRKMRDARSFFTEGVMVASWMMIAANPMLAIGILMLLSDRHWQTSFFDYSGGGDTVLFQHMFWFFGHPEVYVIMIPAFGFTNTILSYYLRKRVSARASLLYSMYTIAFLGFFVWGHHMYMVGLAHTTRMLFSTLTVMISVPAATKLMHWCVTLVNSAMCMELPFLFTLLFIFFFVSGGISGMAVAHTGMDILFHDSFYVVGHFHVMFAGSAMFASFGAFYFYFPAIFGCKYSRIWGYLHCVYYLLGQLMTVIPMFWLGYGGMPRRVLDYPAALGGWHAITSAGHLLSVAGMLAFFIMIFDSHRQFRAATLSTLGVSRFSVRLTFYIYEIARVRRITSRWGLNISSYNFANSVQLNELNFVNKEPLESTLYSYTFVTKS